MIESNLTTAQTVKPGRMEELQTGFWRKSLKSSALSLTHAPIIRAGMGCLLIGLEIKWYFVTHHILEVKLENGLRRCIKNGKKDPVLSY